jgi:hypothetical protein
MKRNYVGLFPAIVAVAGVVLTLQGQTRPPATGLPGGFGGGTEEATAVKITFEGDYRVIRANGIPDHLPGQFPNRNNPNTISSQRYEFRIPLKPQVSSTPRRANGQWFGVAVNGVPFEPGTAEFWNGQREWTYEAKGGYMNLGLDQNNAHVQPTGAYHYHGLPIGLIAKLGGDSGQMLLIGWAADGFPIYTSFGYTDPKNAKSPLKRIRSSYKLKQGTRSGGPGGTFDGRFSSDFVYVAGYGDLDECNGRFGITPEFPSGTYHYYITEDFPWIGRQWRGTPDSSFFKAGPGRGLRPGGEPRPPLGGFQPD